MNRLKVVQDDPKLSKRKELAKAIQGIRELLRVCNKVFLTDSKGEVRITICKRPKYGNRLDSLQSEVNGLPLKEGKSYPDETLSWAIDRVLDKGIGIISPLLLPNKLSGNRYTLLSEKEINALHDFISQATIETEAEIAD